MLCRELNCTIPHRVVHGGKTRFHSVHKCGEEATEVVVAAMKGSREETIYELADLCYHALVLMVQCGVTLDEVRGELAFRHVVDHKVKQEALR